MKVLDLYLGKAVVFGSIGALLILVMLETFFSILIEIGDVGQGQYGWLAMLQYIAMTMPMKFYELFPTGVLVGSLFSLGAMASQSELIAMRAAGIPIVGVVRSALKAGVLMVIVAVAVGELVAPQSLSKAHHFKVAMMEKGIKAKSKNGIWARNHQQNINISEVLPGMRVKGVTVYDYDENGYLKATITASQGQYEQAEDRWSMSDVARSTLSSDGVISSQVDQEYWSRLLSPNLFKVVVVKPEQLSAWDLAKYIDYLRDNKLETSVFELAFWVRFTTPLSALVMLLLALPFVFASQRGGNAGQRLFIGILVGLVFYISSRMVNHLGLVVGLPPIVSAAMPVVSFLIISLLALRRVNRLAH